MMGVRVCCVTRKNDNRCVGNKIGGSYCSIEIEDFSEVFTVLQNFTNHGCICEIPTEEVMKTLEVYISWDDINKQAITRPFTEDEWNELSIMEW